MLTIWNLNLKNWKKKKKKAEIAKVTAETRPNHIPSPRKKLQNIKIQVKNGERDTMLTLTKQTYKKDGVVTLFLHKKTLQQEKFSRRKRVFCTINVQFSKKT